MNWQQYTRDRAPLLLHLHLLQVWRVWHHLLLGSRCESGVTESLAPSAHKQASDTGDPLNMCRMVIDSCRLFWFVGRTCSRLFLFYSSLDAAWRHDRCDWTVYKWQSWSLTVSSDPPSHWAPTLALKNIRVFAAIEAVLFKFLQTFAILTLMLVL